MVEPATERYLRAQIEALRTDAKVVAEHREAERASYRARITELESRCSTLEACNIIQRESIHRQEEALFDLQQQKKHWQVERNTLREALCRAALRNGDDGPCFCVVSIPPGSAHHLSCQHIRQALNTTKKEGT